RRGRPRQGAEGVLLDRGIRTRKRPFHRPVAVARGQVRLHRGRTKPPGKSGRLHLPCRKQGAGPASVCGQGAGARVPPRGVTCSFSVRCCRTTPAGSLSRTARSSMLLPSWPGPLERAFWCSSDGHGGRGERWSFFSQVEKKPIDRAHNRV